MESRLIEIARKTEGRVQINLTAVRGQWNFADLFSADGQQLSVSFQCSLRPLPDPAERKLLEEIFLNGQSEVRLQEVIEHFTPALQAAAARFAGQSPAGQSLSQESNRTWAQTLRSAAEATAFSCGIEVLAPLEVTIRSPSLEREQLEKMQRTVAERQTAGRVEHFQRAAELLKQWESLRASVPSLTPGHLLQELNPADRGAMLETLLMASGRQTTPPRLWAVAGNALIRVDLSAESPITEVFPLPPKAGPLRSLQVDGDQLLVGARSGIWVVSKDRLNDPRLYCHPHLTSEFGFTRAVMRREDVWACHREAGIVIWKRDAGDKPAKTIAPAELGGAPRHLLGLSDSSPVLFAVGSRLCRWDGETAPVTVATAPAEIVALLRGISGEMIAVSEDGTVVTYSAGSLEKTNTLRPVAKASGAALLPWLTSQRLLLFSDEGAITCIGLDDQLVTQFAAPQWGSRAASACAGQVAAMTPDRQRVLVWNSWDGRRPAHDLHLIGLTKHRLTDLAFG